MAARGALRTGAGLVSVATPHSLVPIIQQQIVEAMCIPAAESIDGTLGIGAEMNCSRRGQDDRLRHRTGLSTHYETVQVGHGT